MQEQKNEIIKQRITDFELHIDAYRVSLNTEGVWLFLATLGCWSVTDGLSQVYAIVVTFILFSYRIYSTLNDKRPFSSISNELEDAINNELEEGDTKKARLLDLYNIRNTKLSLKNHLKSTAIFLLCYSFLGVTMWHAYQVSSQ